jgi:hypothetical protein
MIGERKLIYLLIILTFTNVTTSFDPLSMIGLGIGAGSFLSTGWNGLVCKFTECCDGIPYNLTSKTPYAGCNIWQILYSYMKRLMYC